MIPFNRLNIGVGAALVCLVGVIGALMARPADDAVLVVSALSPEPGSTRQSHIALLDARRPQEKPRVLTSHLFSACAPAVSYDGRWLLFAGQRTPTDPWQVWEMQADGSHLRQVTRMAGDCTDPCYLPDGRIAFSGAVSAQPGPRALFTCARDGSRVERITFSESQDVKPTVLPDGRLLFVRMGEGKASQFMTVNTDGTGLQRFYGGTQTGGRSLDRHENPPESILIAPRPRPRALTSVVDKTKKTGRLLCLNVYLSQLPEAASLRPGEVKQVQVSAVKDGRERLLGKAVVEEDGSFYLDVPADTLLRLRLLRADGHAVASLTSGIWVRPNEQRGCIGCHEDPELSPENRVPLAVMKPPVVLADDEDE